MSRISRAAAVASLGSASLVLGVVAATATTIPVEGEGGVPLEVEISDLGALSMTVDTTTPVVLTESGSDEEVRQFTGVLPTVTVTDTRQVVDDGVGWGVFGDTSDFVSAEGPETISGTYLGWAPRLVEVPVGDDLVVEGAPVLSEADESAPGVPGTGVVGGFDLLVSTTDSAGAQEFGASWSATADLELRVPVEQAPPGSYTSTLTLSLFEG